MLYTITLHAFTRCTFVLKGKRDDLDKDCLNESNDLSYALDLTYFSVAIDQHVGRQDVSLNKKPY